MEPPLTIARQALAYSASRTSKSIQHLHSIYVSTFGLLFLGTPHDGSAKARLAAASRRMIGAMVPAKVLDTEGQLLDALREGSETLQNVTDAFVPLMKQFRVFFFWEQVKTGMGVTQDYVCFTFFSLFPFSPFRLVVGMVFGGLCCCCCCCCCC